MTETSLAHPTEIKTDRQEILIGMSLEMYRYVTLPMKEVSAHQGLQGELTENSFATEPMLPAQRPRWTPRREQEEEWHTSFEQAISERAARVSQRLRRLSTTALDLECAAVPAPALDALPVSAPSLLARARHFWRTRKRTIVLFSLGLALFLAGFDLMGLLVLLR